MIYTVVWTVQSSALVAQTSHSGFESESLPYVPGSAWRGAAAGAYLTAPGAKASDERFRRLFLEDRVHYGDLRPQGLDVWPLSVRRCKDRPEEHATVDALLASASGRLPKPECAACQAKRGPGQGYIEPFEDGRHRDHRPPQQLRYHVQIDSATRSARSGQFFAMRTLNAGQRMMGRICADEPVYEDLRALLPDGVELSVGRGRSRGQGQLVLDRILPCSLNDLEARIRKMNGNPVLAQDRIWFSVTFLSPAILLDEWLLCRSYLLGEDIGLPEYTLAGWFSRTVRVSGWHAAAGLPKGEAVAVSAGSAFLFSRQADGVAREDEYERLTTALVSVEEWGVGERCAEGFGEAVVCHDLHSLTPGPEDLE
jgi:CRISPR-associated protein Csx10